jgi:hypothetical protein
VQADPQRSLEEQAGTEVACSKDKEHRQKSPFLDVGGQIPHAIAEDENQTPS